MDFLRRTKKIISNQQQKKEDKVIVLCNLLIPKIMYIPPSDRTLIQEKLKNFQLELTSLLNSHQLLQIIIAFLEYRKSNYQDTLNLLLPFYENKNLKITMNTLASSRVVVGASYRSLGQKEKALHHFQQAIEVLNTKALLPYQFYLFGLSLYHVGEIYGELKGYNEMLNKHLMLLEKNKKWKNIDFKNRALNGVGRAYLGQKQYLAALDFLKRADVSSRQAANIPFIARNLNDLGIVYAAMKQYDASLKYYKKALHIRKENNLYNATITTYIKMSEILITQRKTLQAIHLLEEALNTARNLNVNKKIYQIYQHLSAAYETAEQYQNAIKYYKKFHLLKEKVENVDKTQVENQKIREINTQLRQQKKLIAHQKQQIEQTLEKLKEANKYLENFAAVAAHDLKAPIRIAAGLAKNLNKKFQTILDPQDLISFQFISNNIGRLGNMIDDLLALSKVDQNLPPSEVVDLQTILENVQGRLAYTIISSHATIICQNNLPDVVGHTSLLTQLFQNLIDNAIKHSKKHKRPKIIIFVDYLDNSKFCQIEIKDNGQGITERLQPFIFELFNGIYRKESSGIGLATCKKIVTHYGGKIWVNSEVNVGTSIFFTLPLI